MFGKPISGAKTVRSKFGTPSKLTSFINYKTDNRPYLSVRILDQEIVGLLDSGATCTVLGNNCYDFINKFSLKIHNCNSILRVADNSEHSFNHFVYIPFQFQNSTKVIPVFLVPSINKNLILGIDFWKAFHIQPTIYQYNPIFMHTKELLSISNTEPFSIPQKHKDLTPEMDTQLKAVISKFQAVCDGLLTRTNVLHHEIDTGDAKPIKQKYYLTSPYMQAKINAELDRMLSLGVIKKSESPWSNPMIAVKKSNGNIRLCMDSRKLNAITKKDAYPLPHIAGILGRFVGTKFLSSIDLKDAFWQVPLSESSKEKTAFTIPTRGLFEFNVMPFGLHNAPQTQCRLMDQVLGADLHPYVFVYLDDIVVATETFEHHIKLLEEVAIRLKRANLSINVEKSKFCVSEISYLGYIVNENGLRTDPEKMEAILNYAIPKSVKDVRRLIGLGNWYRRFIPDFSSIVSPITELMKGKVKKFKWTDQANSAFLKLKSALISAPVLSNPDFSRPFKIQCDASDIGIGAVLSQDFDEGEKVIAYMSAKLTSTQRKYTATERECLAVLMALDKFRPYVDGVHFTVITDHASLLWLLNLKDPTGRLSRWALKMQHFDMTLVHRKGKENVVPDALSRAVESMEVCEVYRVVGDWYTNLKNDVTKNPEKFPTYRITGDDIYKHTVFPSGINHWVLVVPDHRKLEILFKSHDNAAHLGFFKTTQRMYEKYFWPEMRKDIARYVSDCKVCKACKQRNIITRPIMGREKLAERPWQIISVDYMGPLPRSRKGNTSLLVITDWFSKFVLLFPQKQAKACKLIEVLENEVFLMYGVPQYIISDNGSQFIAKSYKKLLSIYSITPWYNSLYHPQNNPTERVNKVLGTAIRCYVKEDHRTWDEEITKIGWAIRTAVHEASKFSPYAINFGLDMMCSGNEYLGAVNDNDERLCNLVKLRKSVQDNLTKAYQTRKKYYDLRAREVKFKVGETVWKKNFVLSDASNNFAAKLAPKYVECKVSKVIGSNTYELCDEVGKILGNFSAADIVS